MESSNSLFYELLEETGEEACPYCGSLRTRFSCCGEVHFEPTYSHPWIDQPYILESEIEEYAKRCLPIGKENKLYETV